MQNSESFGGQPFQQETGLGRRRIELPHECKKHWLIIWSSRISGAEMAFGDVSTWGRLRACNPRVCQLGGSLLYEGLWPWMRWLLLWVELQAPSPNKRYVESLNTCTYKCNLILKWGLCRHNQVKMRSYLIMVGSTPVTDTVMYEWNLDTESQEECQVQMKSEIGVMHLPAKGCQGLLATTWS